jgi:hypothetical protein
VYADANIDPCLATDGTSLYFISTTSAMSELDSVGLDGTGEKMLASGFMAADAFTSNGPGAQLFVASGNVYFAGFSSGVMSVPTTGGTATSVANVSSGQVQAVLWADASGVYFLQASASDVVQWIPLAGGTPTVLFTSAQVNAGFAPIATGGFTVIGGTAYFMVDTDGTSGAGPAALMKSSGGAMATTVATYMGEAGQFGSGLIGDASGMYEFVNGNTGGIDSVDVSTGAQTLVDSPGNLNNFAHALDAAHLYFGQVGNSQFSLWSRAR